ncbi:suppressor protein SRP40 [Morus notabilis]|nr:suppressor protein SRP40 [Morus notabilis]
MNPKPDPTTTDHDMIDGHGQNMMINKFKPADHVQVEDHDQDEELLPFVCPVCNKRYKSGKALGGHKRMHNLPPKNNNKRKAIIHDDEEEDEEGKEEEDVPICLLCEKIFPSMKSLFGHMRSHPDRGWRGIQPPPSAVSEDHRMIGDDDDDFLEETPEKRRPVLMSSSNSPKTPTPPKLNWSSGTAKRVNGSSTTSGSSSSSSSSGASNFKYHAPWKLDNAMKEAAINLMLLTHLKPRSESLSVLDRINKSEGEVKEEGEEEEEEKPGDKEEYYDLRRIKKKHLKSKKRVKKMKLADLDEEEEKEGQVITNTSSNNRAKLPASSSIHQYVCSVCERSFPSYQALGGHRSSHNKKHIKINNKHVSNSDADGDDSSRSAEAMDDKGDVIEDDPAPSEKDDSKIFNDFDLNEIPHSEDGTSNCK